MQFLAVRAAVAVFGWRVVGTALAWHHSYSASHPTSPAFVARLEKGRPGGCESPRGLNPWFLFDIWLQYAPPNKLHKKINKKQQITCIFIYTYTNNLNEKGSFRPRLLRRCLSFKRHRHAYCWSGCWSSKPKLCTILSNLLVRKMNPYWVA